jgi:hypothetical protein
MGGRTAREVAHAGQHHLEGAAGEGGLLIGDPCLEECLHALPSAWQLDERCRRSRLVLAQSLK